ncbi:MAG: ECF transporter S component [Lachnospiraceae bacterium]|nr:ECF transporter S component [Lachnospiraceae bacterium]
MEKKKFGTREIAITAILLALCVVSQIFKNLSVFITGPIVNTCLLLAELTVGLPCAIILGMITPITAFFMAPSPVMSAVPGIIPLIMLGNIVLVLAFHFLMHKDLSKGSEGLKNFTVYLKAVVCALAKGVVMGVTIGLWLLPTFLPAQSPLREKLPIFKAMFSVIQFVTACIGFVYLFILWAVIGRKGDLSGTEL